MTEMIDYKVSKWNKECCASLLVCVLTCVYFSYVLCVYVCVNLHVSTL